MAQFMGENLIPNINAQNNDNDNQDNEGGNNANNNHNHDSEEEEEEEGVPLQQPIFNPAALTTALQAVFGMNASNLTGRGAPIAKIEPFYGREDEDPVDWLKVFEKAAIANRWEAARRKRDIAASYLREAAADWYDRSKDIMGINWTSGYNNGNNFTDLFIKYFANETCRNRWYQELLTLRQSSNENVNTYANKFVKLLLRVDPENAIPQAQSKRMFLFGLNPAITPMVSMQNNADLGQLIDNARKAETGFNYIQIGPSITGIPKPVTAATKTAAFTPITPATATTSTSVVSPDSALEELTKQMEKLSINYANLYSAFQKQNRPRNNSRVAFNNNGNNSQATRNQPRANMANTQCYNCGQLGHFSRNCPRGNNSNRNGRNNT